ncbi:uncharacterized protein LOC123564267 [Mercenaria mercenaria]|uniref:uncharacterized protein LOC123564267 n=1 Tax=Mercenaria mercenaria TaxID=6596 RepID=UPI00234EB05E|nr:uncharacterized protein LOC123564267 [Mercenaria mercenaria]
MSKKSAKETESVSNKLMYRDGLKDEEKVRYDEKLKILGGCDPYEIVSWSTDVSLLPPVTYIDIVNYLLWTPSVYTKDELKSYKGLEAYNQFVNGWVRDRSSVVCNGYTVVTAKVLHSQWLRPWIIGDKSGQVLGAHCTCMAGLGEACTHIAALLFAIDATVRIRDSKTVTDEKAYWLLPSAMKAVEYKKVQEIDFTSAETAKRKFNATLDSVTSPCVSKPPADSPVPSTPITRITRTLGSSPCVSKPPADSPVPSTPITRITRTPGSNPREDRVPEASDEDMDILYKKFFESGAKSAILSIVEPYCDSFVPTATTSDFPKVLSELRDDKCYQMNYKEVVDHCEKIEISCSKDQSAAVEFATRDQSRSKLWNSFRADRITASRMKSVCSTDEASLAPSLIKAICYPDLVKFKNNATKWGCEHERMARDQFLQAMSTVHENSRVEDVGFTISTSQPFIGASPDGVFTCDCCGTATVEIKCPFCIRDQKLNDCKYLDSNNGMLTLSKSHEYYFQVQTQLGCCEVERGYFVVWTEKDLHIEEIIFDSDLWNTMCERSKKLFISAVLPELVGNFFSKIPTQFSRPPLVSTENKLKLGDNIPVNTTDSRKRAVNEAGEEIYCYCEQVEHGKMIGCDNDDCEIQWFHYACVKIEKSPRGKWYCHDCRKLPQCKRQKVTRKK